MSDSTFRIALPLIGGAIGLALGNPALGFAAGSMLAQILFPPPPQQVVQPMITDWRLSQSGLGVDIPFFICGDDRVPGSLTYHGGVKVVSTTTESGGKGGPTVETTTHAYFATFSVVGAQINYDLLHFFADPDDPSFTTSIRRVWMGGTLVYDASEANTGAVSRYSANIFLRLGGELEVAHSKIQAKVGINLAPTYRGRPGIDFINFPLADFSNQAFPAPSMEIVNGPPTDVCLVVDDAKYTQILLTFGDTFAIAFGQLNGSVAIKKVDLLNNQVVASQDVPDASSAAGGSPFAIDHEGNIYLHEDRDTGDNSSIQWIVKHEFNTLAKVIELAVDPDIEFDHGSNPTPVHIMRTTIFKDPFTGKTLTAALYVLWSRASVAQVAQGFNQSVWVMDPDTFTVRAKVGVNISTTATGVTMVTDDIALCYFLSDEAGIVGTRELTLYIFDHFGLQQTIDLRSNTTVFDDFEYTAGMGAGDTWDVRLQCFDESTNGLIIKINNDGPVTDLWVVNISTDNFTLTSKIEYPDVTSSGSTQVKGIHLQAAHDGLAWAQYGVIGSLKAGLLDLATMVETRIINTDCSPVGEDAATIAPYESVTKSFVLNEFGGGSDNAVRVFIDRVGFIEEASMEEAVDLVLDSMRPDNPLPRSIGSLFAIKCEGYSSRRHTTGRAVLEPVARDRAFDLVESDAKIKAVVRGGAPIQTLDADDLGASSEGDEAPDVEITRAHSLELPARIDYKYRTSSRDYNVAVQGADFPEDVITSRATVSVSSPVNMTDQQASDIVHRIVDTSHIGEGRVKLSLFPEFIFLDPGDVIAAPIEGEIVAIYIQSVSIGANRLVEVEGITDDPKGWSQTTIPAVGDEEQFFDGTVFGTEPPVRLFFMDVALFRDQDDVIFGPYAAIAPYTTGGNGAFLYRHAAGGEPQKVGAVNTENYAIAGDTLTVLPSTTDLYVLDETSTVDVRLMHSGMTLSGVSELQAFNGENAMLIGDEVVVAQTVVNLTATDWRLSNFRRAERGTEWAVGTHKVAERFVLLTPSTTIRLPMDISEKDVEYFYQAVPLGGSALDAMITDHTWTGEEKRPLFVVHVESALVGNDKQVDWIGRSRVGGDFLGGTDIPTAEETLEYQIDVFEPGTAPVVLNTYTVTTETWTYLLSEYNVDFGVSEAQVGSVDIIIYQMSATVGRGHPTALTI